MTQEALSWSYACTGMLKENREQAFQEFCVRDLQNLRQDDIFMKSRVPAVDCRLLWQAERNSQRERKQKGRMPKCLPLQGRPASNDPQTGHQISPLLVSLFTSYAQPLLILSLQGMDILGSRKVSSHSFPSILSLCVLFPVLDLFRSEPCYFPEIFQFRFQWLIYFTCSYSKSL